MSKKPLGRLERPQTLLSRTEQVLREAIARGEFAGNRLPSAAEIAEQLGVSRETVRQAQESLQQEGLLVKYRRKGTLLQAPAMTLKGGPSRSKLLGYLQTDYHRTRESEDAMRATGGLMLQGAMREAGRSGFQLVVHHAPSEEMDGSLDRLSRETPVRGVIFVSFVEDKLVRRTLGLGLPVVLLDHELNLPSISTVREDSRQGASLAVAHLAKLGHRRIAYAHWSEADVNPWRIAGYRQGFADAKLPRRRAWELSTAITEAGAESLVKRILELRPRPTALICFDTTLARLTLERLRQQRIRVPEDLSLMGIGGEEVAGLTCVQADWFAMGASAVKLLTRGRNAAPDHRLFPYHVKPGRTAAPPADS